MNHTDRGTIKAIAIGGFDGIHVGHQQLFEHLGQNGAILVIDTEHTNLTPKGAREAYVNYPIFYLELSDISQLTPEEFIDMLKVKFPKLETIVVGYDFRFGHNRSGEARDITSYFPGKVVIVNEVKAEGISVHSRTIRGYLRVGEVELAAMLLGHTYRVSGQVIRGQGLGMRQLYPTINLDIKNFLLPAEGVYACKTRIEGQWYDSVAFIGHRVTTDGSFAVETHILDADIAQAGETADIEFVKRIRDNMMFAELDELKAQIARDIQDARTVLEERG